MSTAVTVVCPQCNNKMRASAEHIGRKGRCPVCKNLVDITAGNTSEATQSVQITGTRSPLGRLPKTTTDVPGWLTGLIGATATAVFYLIVLGLLRNTYLGRVFVNGGSVSVCNTLITFWGIAILGLKLVAVRQQVSYAERELELIPLDVGLQITSSNVDQFLAHLASLPVALQTSILGRRIQGALEHFKARGSVPEVQQYLSTQAEIDASAVDSGYTLLRSYIWANPILGFIGTVVGIGVAVGGLAASFGGEGGDMASKLQEGLSTVTGGLGTAFDTTLIGLVYAMMLLIPTESLRKIEYAMLDRIEGFTNDSLLRRMADGGIAGSVEQMPLVVRNALDSAFREHQRWLAQWQTQVSQLGQVVGADFESMVSRIQDKLADADGQRMNQFNQLASRFGDAIAQADRFATTWQHERQQVLAGSGDVLASAAALQQSLAQTAELCRQTIDRQNHSSDGNGQEEMAQLLRDLRRELARLSDLASGEAAPTTTAAHYDPAPAPRTSAQELPLPDLMPTERADSKGVFGFLRRGRK